MHAITRRLPTRAGIGRRRGAILGFLAGMAGTVVLALFGQVVITGYGIGETPPPAPLVYPGL